MQFLIIKIVTVNKQFCWYEIVMTNFKGTSVTSLKAHKFYKR